MTGKNIFFILPCLGHGGVERLTLNLCHKFLKDGFECTIALSKCEGDLLSHLDSRVNVIELAPTNIIQFIPALTKTISRINPIAVITAFPDIGLLTWIAIKLSGTKIRLIHGIHDTHTASSITPGVIGWLRKKLFNLLAKIIYRFADALVAVSTGVGDELRDKFKIKSSKIHIIYNPIIPDDFFLISRNKDIHIRQDDSVHIVALGRLVYQKGFDLLIESMSNLKTKQNWTLSIYGNGPDHRKLGNLIDRFCLSDRVKLYGFTDTPFSVLASADLFVMPSRHEGFGNVLVEALACGIPVIAADCPHGPSEILMGGKYGKLVPPENIAQLTEAIFNFLESNEKSCNSSIERATQFTFEASYTNWKKLICSK